MYHATSIPKKYEIVYCAYTDADILNTCNLQADKGNRVVAVLTLNSEVKIVVETDKFKTHIIPRQYDVSVDLTRQALIDYKNKHGRLPDSEVHLNGRD